MAFCINFCAHFWLFLWVTFQEEELVGQTELTFSRDLIHIAKFQMIQQTYTFLGSMQYVWEKDDRASHLCEV